MKELVRIAKEVQKSYKIKRYEFRRFNGINKLLFKVVDKQGVESSIYFNNVPTDSKSFQYLANYLN